MGDIIRDAVSSSVSIAFDGVVFSNLDADAQATGLIGTGVTQGVVLSTGRAVDIQGSNLIDGRQNIAPGAAANIPLNFERIYSKVPNVPLNGVDPSDLIQVHIYRAELPTQMGAIQSITLTDDRNFRDGLDGFVSAFDLDAIGIGADFILSLGEQNPDGSTRQDIDVLTALQDLLNSPDNPISYDLNAISFAPGEIRGTTSADRDQPNLLGAINGAVDLASVRLDRLDGLGLPNTTGSLSLGEGGQISFDLSRPIDPEPNDPLYIYAVDIGGREDLADQLTVSAAANQVSGDLSTDLGRPGVEGDRLVYTAEFVADFNNVNTTISAGDFVDLFEVVLITEELPERAGAVEDIVSIKANGIDVLLDPLGGVVTLNSLALSPTGPFDDALTLNLAGEGIYKDELRADALTSAFRVSAPILDGLNRIEIELADGGDGLLDTALIIRPLTRTRSVGEEDQDDSIITVASTPVEFEGLGGDDSLTGGPAADLLIGGDGDDDLFGGEDADTLQGGAGRDLVVGEAGDDLLEGGAGADDLIGSLGNDILFGALRSGSVPNDGNDTLTGADGNDFLSGQDGNDVLDPGDGEDTIIGGRGTDIALFDGEDLGNGIAAQAIDGAILLSVNNDVDRLEGVEIIRFRDAAADGGDLDITLRVDGSIATTAQRDAAEIDVVVYANGAGPAQPGTLTPVGDDITNVLRNDYNLDESSARGDVMRVVSITGADGLLRVVAENGVRSAEGRFGSLTINADGTYSYAANAALLRDLDASGPAEDVFTYRVDDGSGHSVTAELMVRLLPQVAELPDTIEIFGTGSNDNIAADPAAPGRLFGLDGDDTLDGTAFGDELFGGGGADVLMGGLGADLLQGGAGNDLLVGDGGVV